MGSIATKSSFYLSWKKTDLRPPQSFCGLVSETRGAGIVASELSAASALIQPASLNVPVGQTTTINCWIGRGESQYTRWFKQIPGETPQLILEYKRFSSEANFYGSGFSSSRFTSKSVDEENNQLVIKGTEVGDTAMYYCEKWVSAENQAVAQRHRSGQEGRAERRKRKDSALQWSGATRRA
ncbi:KV10 protein, partial [Polypterus senegalus]